MACPHPASAAARPDSQACGASAPEASAAQSHPAQGLSGARPACVAPARAAARRPRLPARPGTPLLVSSGVQEAER